MTWYLDYGFSENPFNIKNNTNLVGIEKQKSQLLDYLKSGDICFLNGPTGVGKSSLLKWIKHNLKEHTIIYIDAAEIEDNFTITNCLKENRTLLERIKRKKFPENTIILLDESQDASPELIKALKLHWDHNNIKSIVITQISPDLRNHKESFLDRIGNRVIKLGKISKEEALDLIMIRTKNKNLFDIDALEKIFEFSNYIPRKILETCEIIAIKLKNKKQQKINILDVEKILNEIKSKPEIKKETLPEIELPEYTKSFSPMQQKIITFLAESPKTAKQLSTLLSTSEGSVGKQLSKLSHLDVVKIISQKRPKRYSLVKE